VGKTLYGNLKTKEVNNLITKQRNEVQTFGFALLLPTYTIEGYTKHSSSVTTENDFNYNTYEVNYIKKDNNLTSSYRIAQFPMSGQAGPDEDCSYVSFIKSNDAKGVYKDNCSVIARSTLGCDVYVYKGISSDDIFCDYKDTAIVIILNTYDVIPKSEFVKVLDSMKPASKEQLIQ
jgi:hypothetical protein